MGQATGERLWNETLDLIYLDKESIFQSGDVLAVTTDLIKSKKTP